MHEAGYVVCQCVESTISIFFLSFFLFNVRLFISTLISVELPKPTTPLNAADSIVCAHGHSEIFWYSDFLRGYYTHIDDGEHRTEIQNSFRLNGPTAQRQTTCSHTIIMISVFSPASTPLRFIFSNERKKKEKIDTTAKRKKKTTKRSRLLTNTARP